MSRLSISRKVGQTVILEMDGIHVRIVLGEVTGKNSARLWFDAQLSVKIRRDDGENNKKVLDRIAPPQLESDS